ncbi:hypothetical protein DTO013E5_2669 [Penicillium roqueforti]|nr:hypothetical protein CBS147337_4938 [Penicillium roqueforti]KAI2670481.1 hypothetical protein CBS147355_9206 [Penicillium roqueforti]KAI2702719.1 hypothetical protein CBS147354_9719 [Penicillium roqueforti]KAI2710115.1 hypothetical protein CBS147332_5816 [Penicillium roqueforti]KAI2719591.1 hypothetical protein CBS147318_2897 [Penicillium roqueforti]
MQRLDGGIINIIYENLVSDDEQRHTGDLLAPSQDSASVWSRRAQAGQSQDKKNSLRAYYVGAVIAERTVVLEDELVSFQDIDWQQPAVQTTLKYGATEQDQ